MSRAAKHLLLVIDDWSCHIFQIDLYHCPCKHHIIGVCSGNSASNQILLFTHTLHLLVITIFFNVHSITNNSSELRNFIISKSFKLIQLLVDNVHVLIWYGNHSFRHSKCWWKFEAFMFPNTYFMLTHPYMLCSMTLFLFCLRVELLSFSIISFPGCLLPHDLIRR